MSLVMNTSDFEKLFPLAGASEGEMVAEEYDYHQDIARSAFADMLHDTERNKKYHLALKLAIEKMQAAGKKANVLDIGTGTGLLSIMAAQCGADSIIACEGFKPMAECCLKILEMNGVADKVTVIPKRSTELIVGEDGDMKEKANILVTEVFDTELIGEGALSTFRHAHTHLLEKDCIVVPDSAVIYAQVVSSKYLENWNRISDLVYEGELILKTPPKIRACPGAAAIHDVQLSQLPRHTFVEMSDPLPVFRYDWSGRTELPLQRTVRHRFPLRADMAPHQGDSYVVFMWWDLNMDTEGKIVLSCAPWWAHSDANTSCNYPEDTLPWRDHWMQGIYYLPKPINMSPEPYGALIACQDEYSLWFYLENEATKFQNYTRPVCECGVHMALSRTHIAHMNDEIRRTLFIAEIKHQFKSIEKPVVLDLNGGSLMGLAAAKLGAKSVYILENNFLHIDMLKDYMETNNITNIKIVSDLNEVDFNDINMVVCDPNFSDSILPWDNLKMAHLLFQCRNQLGKDVVVIPNKCEIYGFPVEFLNLHKIRVPVGECEGVDVSIFDDLIEKSRAVSDDEFEPQPLWEYPSVCRGRPQRLLDVDLNNLKLTYACNGSFVIDDAIDAITPDVCINGFIVYTVWRVANKGYSGSWSSPNERVYFYFDPCMRHAVKLLKKPEVVLRLSKWSYQIAADMESNLFNIHVDLDNCEDTPSR